MRNCTSGGMEDAVPFLALSVNFYTPVGDPHWHCVKKQARPPPFIRRRFFWVHRTVDSALNGLKLVLRHQYVALLFGISCLYEVVLTILDYQMKVLLPFFEC